MVALAMVACAGDEELPFVEFDGLGYGAFPRLIDGVNGGLDYEDPAGSNINFTVEFYDDAQGANVQSYVWDVSYEDRGPARVGSADVSSFGTSPAGYPSASFTFSFQEVFDALGMSRDDITGGAPFVFTSTLTKTDGSEFTWLNTDSNIQGNAVWAGFFRYDASVLNLPCNSVLAGTFDAASTGTNQMAGIGWDDCTATWNGTVRWEALHDPTSFDVGAYRMYSVADSGVEYDDASMGAYYACYGTADDSGLPNGVGGAGGDVSLQESCGIMAWNGGSQWGEVYSFSAISVDGINLTLEWANDYGEGARTVLTRTDGEVWQTDLTCDGCE